MKNCHFCVFVGKHSTAHASGTSLDVVSEVGGMQGIQGAGTKFESTCMLSSQQLWVPSMAADIDNAALEVAVRLAFSICGSHFSHFAHPLRKGCFSPAVVCREDFFSEVMKEREDIASRREACQKALRALQAATSTLNTLPQTLMSTVSSATASR